jgi:predicted membrane protein
VGAVAEEYGARARDRAERLRSKADRVQARAERVRQHAERLQVHAERINRGETDNSRFHVDVFMSNVTRAITSQELEHGSVTALMGGVDVDLRSADLAGGKATIDVSLVMGGLNLVVPDDWIVEFQGTPIMGSVDDQSRRPAGEPDGRLLVEGTVLMSSIIIRN